MATIGRRRLLRGRGARPARPAAIQRPPGRAGRSRRRRKRAAGMRRARRPAAFVFAACAAIVRHGDDGHDHGGGKKHQIDGEDRAPSGIGEGCRDETGERDAGRHEGAPQRQRDRLMARLGGRGHRARGRRRRPADSRCPASVRPASSVVASCAAAQSAAPTAMMARPMASARPCPMRCDQPPAGRPSTAPTRVMTDTAVPATASDRPRSCCRSGTSGGTMPSCPAASTPRAYSRAMRDQEVVMPATLGTVAAIAYE